MRKPRVHEIDQNFLTMDFFFFFHSRPSLQTLARMVTLLESKLIRTTPTSFRICNEDSARGRIVASRFYRLRIVESVRAIS